MTFQLTSELSVQRNSTYVGAVFVGAFVLEKVANGLGDGIWAGANSGVSILSISITDIHDR